MSPPALPFPPRCTFAQFAPPPQGPLEVWSCPPGKGGHFVRFLGDPVAVWLHWIELTASKVKGRTVPCLEKECPRCLAGDAGQRKSYAPALLWAARDPEWPHVREWLPKVVEVTECAEADIIAA